jgi:predicted protein tyrosine phosphatase
VKVLFVCSRNRLRSLTAETIFDGAGGHQVRSAGTAEGARGKPVVCLYIPDDYDYMDEELIDRLRGGVAPHDGLETHRWNGTKSAFADCAPGDVRFPGIRRS